MKDPFNRPILRTGLFYPDPDAALVFLQAAFGFARHMVVRDRDGKLMHAEIKFGDAEIVVDSEWADFVSCPNALNGKNTQLIYIQLQDGLDAHCANARANGADIIEPPQDQIYGDRTYRAKDIGGHIWTFSQAVKIVTREDAEKAGDMTIEGWF
ncbi:MAG: glyoxalase [Hyphomicrobiales bacterium]|nr:MAG: glyoxalase [Hyphomicrobiales bacterium]